MQQYGILKYSGNMGPRFVDFDLDSDCGKPANAADDWVVHRLHGVSDLIRCKAQQCLQLEPAGQVDEAKCELESAVRFLDSLAVSLAPPKLRSLEEKNWTHGAAFMILLVIQANLLKNQARLNESLLKAVPFVVPSILQAQMIRMLTDRNTSTLPQRETVRVHRFYLDAAFALHWRSLSSTLFAAWFWADKSPQGGRQWLGSFMQFVRSFDDLKRAGEAVNALALGNYGSLDGSDGQQRVQDLTTIVCKCLDRHNNVPGALASAKESLVYTVSTFLNQLRLESESNMALQNLLGKVVSFTVDLGEVSLPQPQHNSFEDWIESWEVEEAKPQNSGGGLEEDDGQDHVDPGNACQLLEVDDGCVHDDRPAADLPQAAECNETSMDLKYLFRIVTLI